LTATAGVRLPRLGASEWWRQINWIDAVSLFLPLVALALLAVRGIDVHSLWRDEIASVVAAKHAVGELVVIVGRDRDKVDLPNMATYYLFLHFWLWLGETEARIRALSLLAAVATVVPVYLLARRIRGRLAAAVAAGIFALHPFVIVYAIEARGYALSMLVVATLTLLLVVGVERRSPWAWLAYGIVAALGIYVHLFVVLTIGAHGLWALATRSIPPWRLALLAALPIAVAAAPLPAIAAQYGGSQDWIDPISVGQVAVAITVMGGGVLVLLATGALSAVAVVAMRRDRLVWLLVATLLVPIVGAVLISFAKPLILARYFVVCLPPLATLAGVGVASLRPGLHGTVAIAVLAVVMVTAVPSAYRDRHEQDWRSLGAWIAAEARPGDRLVVRQWGEQPVTYYLEREGARRWPAVATARNVMRHPTSRVWLVLSVEPGVPEDAVVQRLGATHDTVERRAFGERVTALLLEPSGG
jgi:mannosyltransferase